MAIRKILVPTDGSEYTKQAVEAAIDVAKATGACITALYVVDAAAMASRGDMYVTVTEILNKEGEEAVGYVVDRCKAADVPADCEIVGGRPADVIIDKSKDYDLIVMSTLGKTGVTKYIIGSVAEKVVRMSDCMVLTIRAR